MKMSEECHNNNFDNPLTSRRAVGGKKRKTPFLFLLADIFHIIWDEKETKGGRSYERILSPIMLFFDRLIAN